MAEPAPERILAGRYRLLNMIGSGGMGAVWRAHDEVLGRDVAIKEIVFPPEMDPGERETARRRAVREAQLAARLLHRNIVAVYDIVEDHGRPAIVMELLPYRSLRDAIVQDGPLSPVEAARVGLGVLTALYAAHSAGVLHRDVKPANIVLGPEGRVILTDFGIAKAVDSPELTTTGMLVGSPSYTAPERARGENADEAADLWAVGASLYTAVEGRPPFDRGDALASLTAVVSDDPDPPVHAGPLRPVIEGLLRKDPGNRLGIAEAAMMLHRIVHDEPPTALMPALLLPAAPAAEAGRPGRRGGGGSDYRALLAALALLVATAGIIAFAVVVAGRSPGQQARQVAAPGVTPAPAGVTPAPAGPSSPPHGYHTLTDSTGFSIAVPPGWHVSHVSHYVYIRDPANSGIFLLIDQSGQPKPDPLADWRQQAADRQSTYPGYHLITLRSVRYPQAEKAADWEFTYISDGVTVQVLNRNVLANAHHAYALYWTTPVSDWDASYHYFRVFAATFRPAS
ncbi:MAG TPA: serine/threonine-protein kinase [Streptosporangiaceae bacterium]